MRYELGKQRQITHSPILQEIQSLLGKRDMKTNNNFTDHTEYKSKSTTRNRSGTKKEIVNTAWFVRKSFIEKKISLGLHFEEGFCQIDRENGVYPAQGLACVRSI